MVGTTEQPMAFKRGTLVTFVGPVGEGPCSKGEVPFLSKKYGVNIGDKGQVGCSKCGWTRVTWTRGDGSWVSVPMRPFWLKEGHHEVMEEDSASRDKKHLTTEDTRGFVAGFGNLNTQQLQALDRLALRRRTTNAESDPFEEAIKKGKEFVPHGAAPYKGERTGYTFKHGELGSGYYLDTRQALLSQLRAAEKANKELEAKISGLKEDVDTAAERIEDMLLSNDQVKQRLLQQLDRSLAASSE